MQLNGASPEHPQAPPIMDRRMAEASENSSNNEDSDSCRSGESDGEGETMRSGNNGRANAGATSAPHPPLREGAWAASQPMQIKTDQDSGEQAPSASAGRGSGRVKKPHLKVRGNATCCLCACAALLG